MTTADKPFKEWKAEDFDWAIERSARLGMAAIRKGDYKTAGEARFWIAYFQAYKEELVK